MYDLTLQKKILLYGTFQTIYLIHFIILAHRPECVLYTHTHIHTYRQDIAWLYFYMHFLHEKKNIFTLFYISKAIKYKKGWCALDY